MNMAREAYTFFYVMKISTAHLELQQKISGLSVGIHLCGQ